MNKITLAMTKRCLPTVGTSMPNSLSRIRKMRVDTMPPNRIMNFDTLDKFCKPDLTKGHLLRVM